MINPGRSYNVNDYKEIFLRRKLYFVIPFVLIFTAAVLWAALTPRKYQASTLVLVTPQRVPTELVRPTVTAGILERLNSISQEIMSRTRLEQIIDELKLYQGELKSMKREEVVDLMRKNIKVDLPKRTAETAGYFVISYTGEDPRIVTVVANKLASLFIEENLKLREQQAVGTTEFLTTELQSTKEKLETQGQTLADYKRRNMGSLPEQRDTNIKMLEQLQLQSQRNEESTRALEDRKLLILKALAEIDNPTLAAPEKAGGPAGPRATGSAEVQIEELKKQLADLQSRYTDRHPDIVRTKKRIADLEKNKETLGVKNDPRYRELNAALAETDRQIQRLRDDGEKLRAQVGQYRGRIEGTTQREQEMAAMLQEYNNTRLQYDTLIKKSEEAQQAENLERRQKGEQFRVIDPARHPRETRPARHTESASDRSFCRAGLRPRRHIRPRAARPLLPRPRRRRSNAGPQGPGEHPQNRKQGSLIMYEQFYGLKEKPFEITPDPRFLYMSEQHREAYAHLTYALNESKGFTVITGEVGTGKTTLIQMLLARLDGHTRTAHLFNPKLSTRDFLKYICHDLGLKTEGLTTKGDLLTLLHNFLLECYARKERVVLIIDEAQTLSPRLLEEVRLLTNLETPKTKLLQVILMGQPELDTILADQRFRQLKQRISVRYHLKPLNRDETKEYVEKRLKVAGARDVSSLRRRGHPGDLPALQRHPEAHQRALRQRPGDGLRG